MQGCLARVILVLFDWWLHTGKKEATLSEGKSHISLSEEDNLRGSAISQDIRVCDS